MTYSGDQPRTQGAPDEPPSHVHMPEYVLVFQDDQPPKEHTFTAISDDAAAELMRKQYPRFTWALYHVDDRGRRECFYQFRQPAGQRLGPPRPPTTTESAGSMA
jgi:hypothetical protein